MAKFDATIVAAEARRVLDEHPATWTSYAELCSACGLDRGMSLVVARGLVRQPTEEHWYRIRNVRGVYNVPTDEAQRGDLVRYSAAEADRKLRALGVETDAGRADPARKLVWSARGWKQAT